MGGVVISCNVKFGNKDVFNNVGYCIEGAI
jgi:hypothetical protein